MLRLVLVLRKQGNGIENNGVTISTHECRTGSVFVSLNVEASCESIVRVKCLFMYRGAGC